MPIKEQIDTLLHEKMDRKDFLKYAGTIILGIIGVTGIMRMILGSGAGISIDDTRPKGSGYGNSSYGK